MLTMYSLCVEQFALPNGGSVRYYSLICALFINFCERHVSGLVQDRPNRRLNCVSTWTVLICDSFCFALPWTWQYATYGSWSLWQIWRRDFECVICAPCNLIIGPVDTGFVNCSSWLVGGCETKVKLSWKGSYSWKEMCRIGLIWESNRDPGQFW